MFEGWKKFIRRLRLRIRRLITHFLDKYGPISEALFVFVIGLLTVIIFKLIGWGGPGDWGSVIASFIVAAFTVFIVRKVSRDNAIFIEVTMSYIITGGRTLLDHLLGKMISRTWKREQLKPGKALFKVLTTIVEGKEYELKRRVSEALPVLAEIDKRQTLALIRLLRHDWDDRWKSDLRRRAVEALIIPPIHDSIPLLYRLSSDEVIKILQLREKDEIYTAFACAEVLHKWEINDRTKIESVKTEMDSVMRSLFSESQIKAVHELFTLFDSIDQSDFQITRNQIDKMIRADNVFIRIAISRNILCLSDQFPDTTLDLILKFLDPSEDKNIRRPIARENSVEFIISMLDNADSRTKAEQLLINLITDQDEIIRVTTFDKAEMLVDSHADVLMSMCNQILENDEETSTYLVDRAVQIRDEIQQSD